MLHTELYPPCYFSCPHYSLILQLEKGPQHHKLLQAPWNHQFIMNRKVLWASCTLAFSTRQLQATPFILTSFPMRTDEGLVFVKRAPYALRWPYNLAACIQGHQIPSHNQLLQNKFTSTENPQIKLSIILILKMFLKISILISCNTYCKTFSNSSIQLI